MWLSTLIVSISFIIIFIIASLNKQKIKDMEIRYREKELEKEQNKFYYDIDLFKLQTEFQAQINLCLEEYCLLYINSEEDLYINDVMQENIVDEVYGRMMDRISKPLEAKVKLYRNIKDETDFKRYVRYEVSVAVMGKVLEIDKIKDDTPSLSSMDPTTNDVMTGMGFGEERRNF